MTYQEFVHFQEHEKGTYFFTSQTRGVSNNKFATKKDTCKKINYNVSKVSFNETFLEILSSFSCFSVNDTKKDFKKSA